MNGASGDVRRHLRARTDVHADRGVGVLARLEERLPVVVLVVDRRQAERERVLGERHREAALVGGAAHLGRGQLDVPQRHHGERDQPTLALAGAPVVDHPVVVRLHAEERELLVVALEERLAAEARQRVREADRRVDVVGVHVGQPLGLDPAAGPDLVEGGGGDVELGEADRGRQLRERVDQVVVEPPVARLAAVDALLVGEHAALEVELRRVALDPRGAVLELGGDALGPEVRRLDHVVVDRDDPRCVHDGNSFVGPQYRGSGRAGRSRSTLLDQGKRVHPVR